MVFIISVVCHAFFCVVFNICVFFIISGFKSESLKKDCLGFMMVMFIKRTFFVSCVMFIMCSIQSSLAATCSMNSSSETMGGVVAIAPLNYANISVSNDMPDGTVLYSQRYRPMYGSATVTCDDEEIWYYVSTFTSTPQPLSSWSGTPLPGDGSVWEPVDGKIYETGIPGIGVSYSLFSSIHSPLPSHDTGTTCLRGISCTQLNYETSVFISLIKTGPLSPGIINGANFPTMKLALGRQTSAVDLFTLSFTGSINVTLPTCTTPDLMVSLGKWTVGRFRGKGSVTPWVRSDIHLTNCGTFFGSPLSYWDNVSNEHGVISRGELRNNKWSLTLTPINSVIDSANGIMSVDTSLPDSATGVGIQISAGDVSAADENIIDFSIPLGGTFPDDGRENITIPLSARYIQTNETVTTGLANGKLIYTISYF